MKIKIGDWIETIEGIAKVISIHPYYVEEYSPEYNKGIALFEYIDNFCIYKILCDFKGSIRKRNIYSSSSIILCSKIKSKSKKILDKFTGSDDIKKFENITPKKIITRDVTVWLNIPEFEVDLIKNKIEIFEFDNDFVITDLISYLMEYSESINIENIFLQPDRYTNNIGMVLFNDNFKIRNKRAVFSGFNVFVR